MFLLWTQVRLSSLVVHLLFLTIDSLAMSPKYYYFILLHDPGSHHCFGQQRQCSHLLPANLWCNHFWGHTTWHRGGPGFGIWPWRASPADLLFTELHRPQQHAFVPHPPLPGNYLHFPEARPWGLCPAHPHRHGKMYFGQDLLVIKSYNIPLAYSASSNTLIVIVFLLLISELICN